MILIQGLLAASIVLSVWFAWDIRPWRSLDPSTAAVLFTIALTAAAVESVFLAATLRLFVPPWLALAVFAVNDAAMVWRIVAVRRARRVSE